MCLAFEIAGSYSFCSYITSWNHVPFVRKPPALLAVFSLAVRQETAEQCTNSSPPPNSSFSPPLKSGPLGDNDLTHEDTNTVVYIFQHLPHTPSHVFRQPSGESAGFPFGCMTLHGPEKPPPQQQQQECLHFSRVHFSWEWFTRLRNKQNIAEEVSEGETENSEEGDDARSPFFKEL